MFTRLKAVMQHITKVATVDTNSYTDTVYGGEYYKVTSVVNGTESSMSLATSYEIENIWL